MRTRRARNPPPAKISGHRRLGANLFGFKIRQIETGTAAQSRAQQKIRSSQRAQCPDTPPPPTPAARRRRQRAGGQTDAPPAMPREKHAPKTAVKFRQRPRKKSAALPPCCAVRIPHPAAPSGKICKKTVDRLRAAKKELKPSFKQCATGKFPFAQKTGILCT